jgi:hypothetical protein
MPPSALMEVPAAQRHVVVYGRVPPAVAEAEAGAARRGARRRGGDFRGGRRGRSLFRRLCRPLSLSRPSPARGDRQLERARLHRGDADAPRISTRGRKRRERGDGGLDGRDRERGAQRAAALAAAAASLTSSASGAAPAAPKLELNAREVHDASSRSVLYPGVEHPHGEAGEDSGRRGERGPGRGGKDRSPGRRRRAAAGAEEGGGGGAPVGVAAAAGRRERGPLKDAIGVLLLFYLSAERDDEPADDDGRAGRVGERPPRSPRCSRSLLVAGVPCFLLVVVPYLRRR